jgi:nucleotide-binding universal stress UspA family protein
MRDLKRMLVASDFSEGSWAALERARQLAECFGASIDVVHAYFSPPYIAPDLLVGYVAGAANQTLHELLRKEAEHNLEEFVAEAGRKGIKVSSARAVYGEPASTILQVATEGLYDLIALGTRGRTGLSHVLLGSVAEKVLRRADRPVLTVRQRSALRAA